MVKNLSKKNDFLHLVDIIEFIEKQNTL
jgi:hypothetical protein